MRTLKCNLVILIAIIFSILTLGSSSAYADIKPPISQVNGNFIDATGSEVIFRGFNIMNKGGQNIPGLPQINPEKGYQFFQNFYVKPPNSKYTLGEQWAQFFVANGFNLARVGIFWNSVEPTPGVYNDAYIKKIKDMINLFGKYGIFSVLDFHEDIWFQGDRVDMYGNPYIGMPLWGVKNNDVASSWDNFWSNGPATGDTVGIQDRYFAMYAHVITILKNEPYLLSYSDINEKWPDKATMDCINAANQPAPANLLTDICPGFFTGKYANFKNRFDAMVAKLDKKRLFQHDITAASLYLAGTDLLEPVSQPLIQNSVMGRSAYAANVPSVASIITSFKSIAKSNNSAFIATEFGDGIDDTGGIPFIVNYFDSQQMSAAYWNFSSSEVGDGEGNVLLDVTKPPTEDNIDVEKMQWLARPYPQLVAGTILQFSYVPNQYLSFDPNILPSNINQFDLTYSTTQLSKTCGSNNNVTEIVIPARTYPQGYTAQVTGGRVLSKAGASILKIKNTKEGIVKVKVTGPAAPWIGHFPSKNFFYAGNVTLDGLVPIIPNPNLVPPFTTANVLNLIKEVNSQWWALAYDDYVSLDLTNANSITIDVLPLNSEYNYIMLQLDEWVQFAKLSQWNKFADVLPGVWNHVTFDVTQTDDFGTGSIPAGQIWTRINLFPEYGTVPSSSTGAFIYLIGKISIQTTSGEVVIYDWTNYPTSP